MMSTIESKGDSRVAGTRSWSTSVPKCAVVAVAWALSALAYGPAVGKDNKFEIHTLSTAPELVSGGDVLVKVDVPSTVQSADVAISVDGRDVTNVFHADASGEVVGLVRGLRLGKNTLVARAERGGADQLTVVNHPITGPIFSGPQQMPFICETQAFGLGAPLDLNCSVATRVDYLYRSTVTSTFQPLDPNSPLPPDLAQTTTSDGNTVPYIVRRETGTINRAVYQIAILHQPGTPLPDPWTTAPGWNGRLVYTFGGGCTAGYHQGRSTGQPAAPPNGVPEDLFLGDYAIAKGYAMATSSLNVFGTNCNDVISAETMMMVKEHFIKRYGVPRYTIGDGGSGGSMQQHLIALNYPGLLDGILPQLSFPDTLTFQTPLTDCALIDHAFNTSALPWTLAQKTAVAGSGVYDYCTINGATWATNTLAAQNCDVSIPVTLVYNPVTNPLGARCTLQDTLVNVFGSDPRTNFARRSLDNVGVQYGFVAFNAGEITLDQFLDLNLRVGGFDIDGSIVAERTSGDSEALSLAYQTGQLDNGAGGLASLPIIDVRPYWDGAGNVHDAVRSQIMRARLVAANGNAANQVLVTTASLDPHSLLDLQNPNSPYRTAMRDALNAIDQWLANIAKDHSELSPGQKVIANKPENLVDTCYTTSLQKITDPVQCKQLFPTFGNPRIAAGEPLIQDRLKCQLKQIIAADYSRPLNSIQLQQIRAVFPDGVCDYTEPGARQQPLADTWLSYPRPGEFEPVGEGE
jgi:hypothetical protein